MAKVIYAWDQKNYNTKTLKIQKQIYVYVLYADFK